MNILLRYSFLTHMILTLLLTKEVALAEQTSSQEARPALVGVAVLLEEEGNSNSQEARPALEEGELIFCKDISTTAYCWCGRCSNTSFIRLHP